jgi:hypothetical protein
MLYDIKNDNLKYWWEFDELGDRNDFEFEHSPCACGSDAKVLVGNTTRHRNQFDLYQCQYCGTIRIDPYLTNASIEKYYSDTYGKIKRQDIAAEQLHKRQKKSAKLVWTKVAPFLKEGDKVLDFGGGAGGKVMEILAQGYDVYLKELDQKYFEFGISQGLKPYAEGMKFEFIVLSRVLEHVNEPVKFLEYFKNDLLKDGGHIYLEVPLIENSRGDYLLNEIHIAHKFYFSNLSLKHICALAGFEISYESRNLLIIKPNANAPKQDSAEMLAISNKVMAELG